MSVRPGRYAVDTKVPAMQTRQEIEQLLKKYGADSFGYGLEQDRVRLGFRCNGRMVRFVLAMPDEKSAARAYRSRWRALLLCIKAKLESVATGIESFDEAFMPHVVMPNNQTVGQVALPGIATAYETGKMPPLLSFDGS